MMTLAYLSACFFYFEGALCTCLSHLSPNWSAVFPFDFISPNGIDFLSKVSQSVRKLYVRFLYDAINKITCFSLVSVCRV
jgi:hypothetical protein